MPGQDASFDPGPRSLSAPARGLTAATGAVSLALGLVLFLAPEWSAPRFPWRVSEFVAMTIGGWCLGNAVVAALAVSRWRWRAVYGLLVYLWAFSLLETLVLVWFRDLIRLDAALTWPYLLMLAVGLGAAGWGVADLRRLRPGLSAGGREVPPLVRGLVVMFVMLVLGISLVAAVGRPESFAFEGRIFPEPLSAFTLRAFGAFYLSLAVSAAILVLARAMEPIATYILGSQGLLAFITLAAFANLDRFDFATHPAQSIYIGAYLVVLVGSAAILAWAFGARRTGPPNRPKAFDATPARS